MKAVILARVSTQMQDYTRQISELTEYAKKNGIEIVQIFANKVSGTKKNEERQEIIDLIHYVKNHQIDRVLVLEISRLGRSTLEALKMIELLHQNQICLFVKNYNLLTLDENGEVNPMAKLICTLLLEISSMEKTTIRSRMVSGYQHYRSKGGAVGRKVGYRISDDAFKAKYQEEAKLIKKGISLRNISKITGTSVNTIRKVAKLIQPS